MRNWIHLNNRHIKLIAKYLDTPDLIQGRFYSDYK